MCRPRSTISTTRSGFRLWVVYVADFAGQNPSAWSEQTAQLSALGDRDVLLSVATVDRAYTFSVPPGLSEISSSEQDDIEINEIEPALRGDDWAGAAIAAGGTRRCHVGIRGRLHRRGARRRCGGGRGWCWHLRVDLIAQLDWFSIGHALREHNSEADRLANDAMDRGMGRSRSVAAPAVRAAPQEFEGVVQNGVIRMANGELPEGTRVQIRVKK